VVVNKAAIVIVEGDYASVTEEWFENGRVTASSAYGIEPSEQLLADLRLLVTERVGDVSDEEWAEVLAAAARVRVLLPKENKNE
jgi:hypothetical protein